MAAGDERQEAGRDTVQSGGAAFLRALLDAVPSPLFVVEDDVQIREINQSASQMLLDDSEAWLHGRLGDVVGCVHSMESPEGCGRGRLCVDCVIRTSVGSALTGGRVVRAKARLDTQDEDRRRAIHVLVTASPFEHEARRFVMLLLEDVSDVVELRGIVPICAYCKRIRNDQQYWQKLESYFATHLDVDFTHGICPECVARAEREIEPTGLA